MLGGSARRPGQLCGRDGRDFSRGRLIFSRMNPAVQNRSVLLTGATGGIGRLTAEGLARAGARVLVHGRDAGKVDQTVRALAVGGAPATGFVADLSSLK